MTDLSAEQKAELIGKDLGIDPKDIPDYEVTAEEEAKHQTIEEDDEGDKRFGKTRESNDGQSEHGNDERRKKTSREKRLERKKVINEKFDEKNALIRQLEEKLAEQETWRNSIDNRMMSIDRSQIDNAIRETQATLNFAIAEHRDAFSTGDADKATKSLEVMYDAKRRMEQLQHMGTARQQQTVATPAAPDAIVVSKAQQWASTNKWFDNSNEESLIANVIAEKLIKEGFDPRSESYWDALDDRLEARGVGVFEDTEQSQSQQLRQNVEQPRVMRRSPPVGGGTGRGDIAPGKVAVTLPTALIDAMKQSGAWDNPARKHKIIADYQRVRSEESERARR